MIEDADQIEVTTNDNRVFAADLIGTDPSSDGCMKKRNPDPWQCFYQGSNSEMTLFERMPLSCYITTENLGFLDILSCQKKRRIYIFSSDVDP